MNTPSERIFGLDLMRALAIIMVLCSHILVVYPKSFNLISQVFLIFGYWGVEIFFVLSGFLIGTILFQLYINGEYTIQTVCSFIKRRWFRTLPNYFLILILNIILAYLFDFFSEDVGYYFFFLQNLYQPMKPFFPESWSLSVEEFAYVLTPFVLLIASIFMPSRTKSRNFGIVIFILILIFFGTKIGYYFSTSNTTINQWNVSLKPVVIYRVDAILIGVLASWVRLKHPLFWIKYKKPTFYLGLLLLSFMFVGIGFFRITIETYPFFWNVLYLPITSVIFSLFLPVLSQLKMAPKWIVKPVTFISLISYAIYLLHYSVVLQLLKSCFDIQNFSINQLHLFVLFYLIITFFLSYLLFTHFEKPIMNRRDAKKI